MSREGGRGAYGTAFGVLLGILLAGCAVENQAGSSEVRAAAAQNPTVAADPPEDKDAGIFQSAAGFYLAAQQAEDAGDRANAARFMAEALKRDPTNVDLLRDTFQLKLSEGQIDEASVLAHRLALALPANQLAGIMLAVEDAKASRWSAAEARLAQLPRIGLGSVVAPVLRAWVLEGMGKTDDALKALDELSKVRGFGVLHDFHAAYINDLAGRAAAAEADYKSALAGETSPSFRVVEAFANFYARQGRKEDALALFTRNKNSIPESVRLAETLKRLGGSAKPAPLVKDAKRGVAEALFDIGSALRQETSARLALEFMRLTLFMEPNFTISRVTLADMLAADRRDDEALALYLGVEPTSPLYFSSRLRVAEVLRQNNKLDDAVSELEALSKKWPDRPEAFASEGDFLRGADKFDAAVKAYDNAIARLGKVEARDWSLFYARGVAYERAGKWPPAEADLLKALDLSPDQPSVLNYLGYSWVDRGTHLERAKELIEKAVKLRPNDGYIVDSLGWVLFREGNFQRAVKHLERAVELRPEDPVINDHLGDAYWRVGRENEARFQWRRALTLKPEPDLVGVIGTKLDRGLQDGSKAGGRKS